MNRPDMLRTLDDAARVLFVRAETDNDNKLAGAMFDVLGQLTEEFKAEADPIREPGPAAMNFDGGTYLAWIQSMGEVLMSVQHDNVPGRAMANYGGLILALAEAAEELQAKERSA